MARRWLPTLCGVVLGVALWSGANPAPAQEPPQLPRFFYYPYYYYPHSYWPTQGPQWPEPAGAPYQRPPAYMAYPPFQEPRWRYELFQPQKYYRGSHFWLDQF
jgi:hypothetical protein